MTSFPRNAFHYAAPCLLVVLALVQIYRAHVYQQSPWKGGGFGMFSTVDSPGARYVRAFLVTTDGRDLEVPLPRAAGALTARAQVIPSQRPLRRIADVILRDPWVWAEYDPVRALSADGAAPAAGGEAAAAPPPDLGEGFRPADQPRVRPLQGGEPEPPAAAFVPVAAVRVELWRTTYDGDTRELRTRRLYAVTRDAEEPVSRDGTPDA